MPIAIHFESIMSTTGGDVISIVDVDHFHH